MAQALAQLAVAIRQMIEISDAELAAFAEFCSLQQLPRKAYLLQPGQGCNDIYFVCSGLLRIINTDREGVDHTAHFALENQFITDYASYLQHRPSRQGMQAIEDTTLVVMPRQAIDWGYQHLNQGQKLGRLIAEYYFIYLDDRINNMYWKEPAERYNDITEVFPNIHNRVPQHMIASYLGITPVHLSRLKKAERQKQAKV